LTSPNQQTEGKPTDPTRPSRIMPSQIEVEFRLLNLIETFSLVAIWKPAVDSV
jgi:hypothetical protein